MKKISKNNQASFRFLEDLCWLLDSNKNIDYSKLAKQLNVFLASETKDADLNVTQLIGVLPSLLTDTKIFKTNRELVEFSEEVIDVDITNWTKKSRNEIIGIIICGVEQSPKLANGILENILPQILNNKDEIINIKRNKIVHNNNFSWNEAIQKITGGSNE